MSSDRPPDGPADPAAGPEDRAGQAGPDPGDAARDALARARKAARDKGLRPGMRPLPSRRRVGPAAQASGPGRDDRDPAPLGQQLERLLDDRGWSADLRVGSVLGRWAEIVGPDVSAHVKPVTFEGSCLTVQADSTAWATQMRLLASAVIGRIDAEVGTGAVTELVVLGPAAPSWVKGRRRVQGPGPRDTYG